MESLRANRAAATAHIRGTQRNIKIFRMWFLNIDVYLASYSRRVLDVWSDHFRHIVCVLSERLLALLLIYNIQRKPPTALFSFLNIPPREREWEGNLHYDSHIVWKIAWSRTRCLKVCGTVFQQIKLRDLCSKPIRNGAADFGTICLG